MTTAQECLRSQYGEAHEAHMAMNDECPWCGSSRATVIWTRTWKATDYDLERRTGTDRKPGPWHVEYQHGRTWCGRHPARLASAESVPQANGPEGQKCTECQRARAAGHPQPYRRNR